MDLPDFKETQFKLMDIFDNLPTWAGNAALNFFKDSWRRQGFVDTGFKAWPKRKHDAASSARNVLMKSGRLRRSLRLRVGQGWFEIYTDVPYAKAHNEGETIKQIVTARQRRFFWAMHSKAKKLGKGEETEGEKGREETGKGEEGYGPTSKIVSTLSLRTDRRICKS